jgi:subtilisin family serine protease
MVRNFWIFLFAVSALIQISGVPTAKADAVPGQFLVKIGGPLAMMNDRQIGRALGATVVRKLPGSPLYLVQRPAYEETSFSLQKLRSRSGVSFAEPNYRIHLNQDSRIPNDPLYGELWGMRNRGQRVSDGTLGVPGIDIGAEPAWQIETGSRKVIVAVIDTGISLGHPDLKANLWANTAELSGKKGVDDDGNGYIDDVYGYDFVNRLPDPQDDHGHGTHVSGIIGASGNNGLGVTGINWNVSLMALKALDSGGEGTVDVAIEAIHYAVKMGAQVINSSWGGDDFSQLLQDAIADAGKKNVLFVAAAGNEGTDNDEKPEYPASYPVANVLAVAAVDNQGELASFSSFGRQTVHLAAPGVAVLSTTLQGYGVMSGTSMASPHVAGVAALLLAHEPKLSVGQLKDRLIRTATPLGSLYRQVLSSGIVNAANALQNHEVPNPLNPEGWPGRIPLHISTAHPYEGDGSQSWEVRVPGAHEFALYFNRFETVDPYDRVTLEDEEGRKISGFSGHLEPEWTNTIHGNYVKIIFTSGPRDSDFGFDITSAAFR